jgi:hypothetical protein
VRLGGQWVGQLVHMSAELTVYMLVV